MFELTNEQRKCFGLQPVEDHWVRLEPKPSPYFPHTTLAYLDGNVIRKYIATGENQYCEYELCQPLSEDGKYLLPKTEKGKPVLLTAASLEKRTGIGMCLSYLQHTNGHSHIDLYSHDTQKCYYSSHSEPVPTESIQDFQKWVLKWCEETTEADLADVAAFAAEPRQHVKFREGDVFRFKLNRRLYGYGRILLDYALMRKKREPFWDILAGKPLACSVYHIATERTNVTVEELFHLPSLPSHHMMDNKLFYGEYEIIGNIPIGEHEDYPIMYGSSCDARYRAELLQCGKLYRKVMDKDALFGNFRMGGIGFDLDVKLHILQQCIQEDSNAPYWDAQVHNLSNNDLRNPKYRRELEQVCKQFDMVPSELLK